MPSDAFIWDGIDPETAGDEVPDPVSALKVLASPSSALKLHADTHPHAASVETSGEAAVGSRQSFS